MELPKAITSNPAQGLANLSGGNKAQLSDQLLEKARVNIDTALKDLESRLSGLSAAEVEARIKMVNTTATVVRDNTDTEVPLKLLVPGDIIRLNAGDMVPADVRLLSAKDLFLNQAALTGESLPVEKKAAPASADVQTPLDLPEICFLGSNIESGSATGVVVHTGDRTYFDYLTFFIMLYVFNAGSNPALFHTGWFVESLFTQTLIIHVIRTNKVPFIQSRASWPLIITSIIIVAVGAWLTVSPVANTLGFVPLPPLYWLLLAIMLPCYVILTQVVKTWFYRKFGE